MLAFRLRRYFAIVLLMALCAAFGCGGSSSRGLLDGNMTGPSSASFTNDQGPAVMHDGGLAGALASQEGAFSLDYVLDNYTVPEEIVGSVVEVIHDLNSRVAPEVILFNDSVNYRKAFFIVEVAYNDIVRDELILRFRPDSSESCDNVIGQITEDAGATCIIHKDCYEGEYYRIKLSRECNSAELMALGLGIWDQYEQFLVKISPNGWCHPVADNYDPLCSLSQFRSYQPLKTSAVEAWEGSKGEGVIIAVIDTGLWMTHEEFAAPNASYINFGATVPQRWYTNWTTGDPYDPTDWPVVDEQKNSHGTAVSSVICAKENGLGVTGMAPGRG